MIAVIICWMYCDGRVFEKGFYNLKFIFMMWGWNITMEIATFFDKWYWIVIFIIKKAKNEFDKILIDKLKRVIKLSLHFYNGQSSICRVDCPVIVTYTYRNRYKYRNRTHYQEFYISDFFCQRFQYPDKTQLIRTKSASAWAILKKAFATLISIIFTY